jgi:NAD(P)-dependent dehydrogenase (short-subunit alcohol dehydrogenase family)
VRAAILDSLALSEKIVVITGAARGLGFAMAQEFSRAGSTVIITSRNKTSALKASKLLSKKSIGLKLNITNKNDVVGFVEQIRKDYERVDVLINNAGYAFLRKIWYKKLHMISDRELEDILQVDLIGSFRVSREIIKLMICNGKGGIIINISSTPALSGYSCGSPYSLAKAGVISLTKHIALEYASDGIRAYSLVLGNIATDATYKSLSVKERNSAERENAMNRWGKPSEVARVATCLASDSFSFATGNTIFIDGGPKINQKGYS